MPLVRLGPHVCNPFPSLTLDGRSLPILPSGHAVSFQRQLRCTATDLIVQPCVLSVVHVTFQRCETRILLKM